MSYNCLCRNFRLADLVTIMNGVCGALSLFSSARYLLTKDDDQLWTALALPVAGCIFDLMDGKIARWRNSSSMLGQELDSLADLVWTGCPSCLLFLTTCLDLVWGRPRTSRFYCWIENLSRHSCLDRFHLLWIGQARSIQCHCRSCPKRRFRKGPFLRRSSHPIFLGSRFCSKLLDMDGLG